MEAGKEKKSKHPIKKTLLTALVVYLVVCALALTGTLAWFSFNDRVSVLTDDENMHITAEAGDLMISVLGAKNTYSNWSYAAALTAGALTDQPVSSSGVGSEGSAVPITNIDASGNGAVIWEPRYLVGDEAPLEDANAFFNATGKPGYCIDVHVKFRTSATMDVYLADTSSVYSNDQQNRITGSGGIAFKWKSLYGDFSCSGICSAVRVAFLEVVNGEEELKGVWIPNDTYQLLFDSDNMTATYTLTGEPESKSAKGYQYIYKNESGKMAYHRYTAEEYAAGDVIVKTSDLAHAAQKTGSEGTTTPALVNHAQPVLSFTANGTSQEKELVIRVWIEGEDREAHYSLNGGQIGYNLDFVGITKDAASLGADAVRYNTESKQIEYVGGGSVENKVMWSLNGIDWENYGTGRTFDRADEAYSVYIKTKETATSRMSNVVAVNVPAKATAGTKD